MLSQPRISQSRTSAQPALIERKMKAQAPRISVAMMRVANQFRPLLSSISAPLLTAVLPSRSQGKRCPPACPASYPSLLGANRDGDRVGSLGKSVFAAVIFPKDTP